MDIVPQSYCNPLKKNLEESQSIPLKTQISRQYFKEENAFLDRCSLFYVIKIRKLPLFILLAEG